MLNAAACADRREARRVQQDLFFSVNDPDLSNQRLVTGVNDPAPVVLPKNELTFELDVLQPDQLFVADLGERRT